MRANHNFFSSWNSSFLYPRLTGTISKPRLTCNASNERSIDRSAARKIVRLFSHLLTFVSSSPPAWSKLAKFHHFGKIVKLFDKLSKLTGCKKSMSEKAIRVKRENFRNSGAITHLMYDKLVFSKIKAAFGGKIKCFITGSAPMTLDLAEDIKILFSVPIVEGYGMTECCAVLTVTNFSEINTT